MFEVSGTGKAAKEALDKVFGIKLNNQSEKFEQIINKLTEQFIQFGEQLAPFFEEGVDAVTKFTDVLAGISPEWKKNIANMLIFQFGLNKTLDVVGILTGAITKAFLTFQGWRYMMMLMNGTLGDQWNIIKLLVSNVKSFSDVIPVFKQLIGIDQTLMLATKDYNALSLTRVGIMQRLKAQGEGWTTQLKQMIGIDQSHLLNFKEGNEIVSERDKLIKFNVESNKLYVKELTKLTGLEKDYNTTLETSAAIKKALLEDEVRLAASKEKLLDANINKTGTTDPKYQQALQETQLIEQQMSVKKTELLALESKAEHELVEVTKQGLVTKELETILTAKLNQSIDANILAKEKAVIATNLRKDAELANIQALNATTLAEAANSTNVVLNTEAEVANTLAKDLSAAATAAQVEAELANVTATQLSIAAKAEEAVATKELILVNTLLGKSYIANNAITRFFFQEVGLGLSKLLLKTKELGIVSLTSFKSLFDFSKGGIPTFEKLLSSIGSGATKLAGLFSGAGIAVEGIGTSLGLLVAPLAAVLLVGAVLYDQFFGTTAQIKKLHEGLLDINKDEEDNERKTLSKLESEGKLDKLQEARLIRLKNEQEIIQENGETYKSVYSSIGEILQDMGKRAGDFFNWINQWNLPLFLIKKTFEGIGYIWNGLMNNFRADQLISTFHEIDKATEKTENSILDITKSTVKFQNGLTGMKDIDKLLLSGQLLGGENIQKIKNKVESDSKILDGQIADNDKRITLLNKQLEKYDVKDDAGKKNEDENTQQLARERDRLSVDTENLRTKVANRREDAKSMLEYTAQREILVKRLKDNELKVDPTTNTAPEDVEGSVNAIQIRLKKGFRLAKEDLTEYQRVVEASVNTSVDGTVSYIDKTGKKIKLSATDMTQYLQKFDNLVGQTSGSIDQLYQNNYINGQDAAKKTIELLDSLKSKTGKDLLDPQVKSQMINQAVTYAKTGSKEINDLLNVQGEKYKALQEGGIISAKDSAEKIRKVQQVTLEESINNQKFQLNLLSKVLPESMVKLMKAQLDLSETQFSALIKTNTRAEIDARFKAQQEAYAKEQTLISLNRAKFITGEEQTNLELDNIKKKDLLSRQEQLQQQLKLVGNDKEARINIEKEILGIQIEYQNVITAATEREITKRTKIIQNTTTKTTQEYKKLTDTLDTKSKSLDEENKIYDSQYKLIQSSFSLEEGRLQNQLKVTSDIQKRADIEVQVDAVKQKNLIVSQKYEQESFKYQQETIQIALQRQAIELNIRKLDNETNSKILQLELEKAIKQKINKEDIDIIQLKVTANKQEGVTLTAAERLLNITKQHQIEISANSRKELENKQELAREGGVLDTEITKQNQIIAKYEKQAKTAQVQAQIADLDGKKRLEASEVLTKSYQLRLDIAQKQLDLENGSQSGIQRQFKLAQDLAMTDYQKHVLAETAAKQELLSLGKKQDIEQKILDMQIKSNELAYEREIIEQEVNKLKLAAALKVAEAEDKKVQVSKLSTDEDKAASTATVEAKRFELNSQKYTDYFLQEKGKSLQQDEQIQRFNLSVKQKDEQQDKQIDYAKTQFSNAGRNEIFTAILNSIVPMIDNLHDVKINNGLNSQAILNKLFSLPVTPNISTPDNINSPTDINLTAPSIDRKGAKNNIVPANPNTNKTALNVTLNVTNDIKVSGKDGTADFEKKLMDSAVLTTKKLYDIIRTVNVENSN